MSTLYDHEYEAKAIKLLHATLEARKKRHEANQNLRKFLNPAFAFA